MATEDINRRVESLTNKKVEPGQEVQELQKTQNELINISNEQRNNLNQARVESGMEVQNNQNLSQAATLMATGGIAGAALQQQVQGFNPQTQALLSKYGVGKPKSESVTTRNTQVSPQKVTINNTTNTTTTNNVQVSQPSIPISSPQIAMKSSDQSEGRLKAWLTGVFASQNEKAAIREKEYQKREWSLSRSTNKLMRRLETLGSTFAEKLDPRRTSSTLGNQLKTIFFLLGFQYIANNWKKILEFSRKVEKFFTEDGYKKLYHNIKGALSGFIKEDLVPFLGGNEGESLGDTLKKLFFDLGDRIADRFDMLLKSRADAVKAIEFPEVDLSDIGGTLKSLGVYLGNILGAIVSGSDSLNSAIGSQISQEGVSKIKGEDANGQFRGSYSSLSSAQGFDNTSLGDASIAQGGDLRQSKLEDKHLRPDGKLANNTVASIIQSNSVESLVNDINTPEVHTSGVMVGLSNLENSAIRNKSTLVSEEFLNKLRPLGIKPEDLNLDSKKEVYKFIRREKTEDELKAEGADIKHEAEKQALKQGAVGGATAHVVGMNDLGKTVSTAHGALIGYGWGAVKGAWNKIFGNKYTLDMVPENHPGVGENIKVSTGKRDERGYLINEDKSKFNYYRLTPEDFDKIKLAIKKKAGMSDKLKFSFDTSDRYSVQALDNLLLEIKKNNIKSKKGFFLANGFNEKSYNEYLGSVKRSTLDKWDTYDQLKIREREREAEFDHEHKDDRVDRVVDNSVELYDKARTKAEETWNDFTSKFKPRSHRASSASFNPNGDSTAFVKTMLPTYQTILAEKGFDPKFSTLLVAQDALESGWGKKVTGTFNFGGIKVDRKNKGKGSMVATTEYINGVETPVVDEFVNFDSPEHYAEYHVNFLNRDRYKVFSADSISSAINRIMKGGYATDPRYKDSLSNVVDTVTNIVSNLPTEAELTNFTPIDEGNSSDHATIVSGTEDSGISPTLPLPQTEYNYSSQSGIEAPWLVKITDPLTTRPNFRAEISESRVSSPILNVPPSKTVTEALADFRKSGDMKEMLSKVVSIKDTLDSQSRIMANLSTAVLALGNVAAKKGNTVVNNYSGSGKQSAPGYTTPPGSGVM